jgi:hypothetical protein
MMAVKNCNFSERERMKRVRVVSRAYVMALRKQGKLEKIADGLYRKKNS